MIALLAGGTLHNASAEDNGLERTPVLGWSSWSFLRKLPTAAQVKAQALALQNSGLQKIGYEYVNLDDFWYQCPGPQGPNVDPYGRWITDSSKFPAQGDTDGIKVVADYIHSLGMKFGIYVTPGISKQAVSRNTPIKGTSYTAAQIADPSVKENNYNCKGMIRIDYNKPGAQEYTNSWADMLAAWGIDYIKIDGMKDSNAADVKAWSNAIRQSAFNGGWLTGKYRRDAEVPSDSRAGLVKGQWGEHYPILRTRFDLSRTGNQRKLDMVEQLSSIASEAGMLLAQMALAFPLAHPGVTGVNFGVRNMRQFNDAKAGFGTRLTDDVLNAIDACNPPGSIVDEADRGWIMPWMTPEARRRHPSAVA